MVSKFYWIVHVEVLERVKCTKRSPLYNLRLCLNCLIIREALFKHEYLEKTLWRLPSCSAGLNPSGCPSLVSCCSVLCSMALTALVIASTRTRITFEPGRTMAEIHSRATSLCVTASAPNSLWYSENRAVKKMKNLVNLKWLKSTAYRVFQQVREELLLT